MTREAENTLSILIADDDEGDRKQVRRALKQAGISCECVETASIEEALQACDSKIFDCAFVDYQMPGGDGLNCIAALHERLPYMSIIMSTGQGDEAVATEAMKRGASDYIAKARISAASVAYAIESALEKTALLRKSAQQQDELQKYADALQQDFKALEIRAHEARIDHLTGLPGRPLFLEQAAILRAHCARNNLASAMLFIDLDGFKAVNDRFGHSHGDAVLIRAAKIFRAALRDADIIGRVGGDEFVVCLAAPPSSIEEMATRIAERIVERSLEIGSGIGCSVGIALPSNEIQNIEATIRRADEAMYMAKESGKNRFAIYGRS